MAFGSFREQPVQRKNVGDYIQREVVPAIVAARKPGAKSVVVEAFSSLAKMIADEPLEITETIGAELESAMVAAEQNGQGEVIRAALEKRITSVVIQPKVSLNSGNRLVVEFTDGRGKRGSDLYSEVLKTVK